MMLEITPNDIEIFTRLLVATILGGLIGFEREINGKEAGFRTYTLVSLGSALMMVLAVEIFNVYKGITPIDPSRIAGQAVTGIGFIGAGAILRSSQGVRGVTTAAGIWAVCGIGLACGFGIYKPAIMTTVLVLIVLVLFSQIQRKVLRKRTKSVEQGG